MVIFAGDQPYRGVLAESAQMAVGTTTTTMRGWLILIVVLLSLAIVLNIVVWVVNWRKHRTLPQLTDVLTLVALVLYGIMMAFLLYMESVGWNQALLGIGIAFSAIGSVVIFAITLTLLLMWFLRAPGRRRPSDRRRTDA